MGIALVPVIPGWIEEVISFFLISTAMAVISYRPRGVKMLVKNTVILYLTAMIMGGVLNGLYFHTRMGNWLYQGIWGEHRLTVFSLLVSAGLTALVIRGCLILWEVCYGKEDCIYTVCLINKSCRVVVRALYDTGNRLTEPVTGKPVCLIEKEEAEQLFTGEEKELFMKFMQEGNIEEAGNLKLCFIPFQAVGTKSGILTGVRIERMEVSSTGRTWDVENPILGVYEGSLSSDGSYRMILHASLLMGKK